MTYCKLKMLQNAPALAASSAAASSSTSSDINIAAAAEQNAKKDPYVLMSLLRKLYFATFPQASPADPCRLEQV